ncbi:hypothetical protein IGI04_030472 [Brassica rapa subsp. trilocularis]|uniref:Uncharacterized protein n=1 Tax=Brassica rapa subsp. trilocularis TaxID=1813537 RepID=A0ABQ7LT74_BRACM|nr:hypothetical protein IGI04_030472 [Brassica rapa subsp. trilocularis]
MEDFLDLEEFLELEDGGKLEDLDSSREVTMKDFLELEEWLEDMDQNSEKKLDDDQHTSRADLETSPKASIDRHQPNDDRQPTHIIDQRPPYFIDRHSADNIYLHPHSIIDRHTPEIKKLLGFTKSEEIHDPVKFVVPCAVVEVEFPIPPDRSIQSEVDTDPIYAISNDINKPASINATTSPSIDNGLVLKQKESDVCENILMDAPPRDQISLGGKRRRNWKKRKRTKGGSQLSLISHFSDGVRKSRVHSRCFSQPFAKLRALLIAEMIDKGEDTSTDETISTSIDNTSATSIDCHFIVSIDTDINEQEPKLTSNTKVDTTACLGACDGLSSSKESFYFFPSEIRLHVLEACHKLAMDEAFFKERMKRRWISLIDSTKSQEMLVFTERSNKGSLFGFDQEIPESTTSGDD